MSPAKKVGNSLAAALQKFARRYPGTASGVACAGTVLESPTVTAGGKAFLFLGAKEARLKLRDSLAQTARFAGVKAGAGGWVAVTWTDAPPSDVLERWIDESYRLIAPKKLVATLAATPGPR